MKSNFVIRTLTGFLFAVVVIGSIVFNQYLYFVFAALVITLGMLEFLNLASGEGFKLNKWLLSISALSLFFAFVVWKEKMQIWGFFVFVMLNAFVFIAELYKKQQKPFVNLSYAVFSQVYIVVPFALFIYLLTFPGYFYPYIGLAVFVLIWANDTFAYIFGVSFGKNRLFERISPKKSWEGAIGGGFSTLIIAWIISNYFAILPFVHWLVIGLIVVVFGNFGDLIQSLYKRSIHVKDSGSILPGHGGILDRFDSFLFATPIVVIYLKSFAI
jgi:phosphatidate cytidylyltransferase